MPLPYAALLCRVLVALEVALVSDGHGGTPGQRPLPALHVPTKQRSKEEVAGAKLTKNQKRKQKKKRRKEREQPTGSVARVMRALHCVNEAGLGKKWGFRQMVDQIPYPTILLKRKEVAQLFCS